MSNRVLTAVLALTACGRGGHTRELPDAFEEPPDGPSVETQPLGMNDISMVRPTLAARELGKITGVTTPRDLVPRALYTRLVTLHHDIVREFDDFVIFAVRFDLCNRVALGPCPEGADGSLRVVFQPFAAFGGVADDVGLHAFYEIPAAELGSVVDELRAIARISATGPWVPGPLIDQGVPLLAGTPRLHALIDRYARAEHLIQLTMMGQDVRSTEPRVVFRGVERREGQMVDIAVVPTLAATEQVVSLATGEPSYAVAPTTDLPAGFGLAVSATAFEAATPAEQLAALDGLAAAENPQLHTAATLPCAACHVSTFLGRQRGLAAGIDPAGLPSRFATARNVSVAAGVSSTDGGSLHAFSWIRGDLAISNRVANETAVVLDEIERRFPAAPP